MFSEHFSFFLGGDIVGAIVLCCFLIASETLIVG